MIKKAISIISSLIIVTAVSLFLPIPAQAVPQPPHRFRGDVTIGGSATPSCSHWKPKAARCATAISSHSTKPVIVTIDFQKLKIPK